LGLERRKEACEANSFDIQHDLDFSQKSVYDLVKIEYQIMDGFWPAIGAGLFGGALLF
jgi:hypothetical protein